jgi:glycosyltransferase involved in cell wall biosynthesis
MYDLIALRKPIVMSRTRAVEAYFDEDCFQLFESGSEHDLARAIYELYAHPDIGRKIVAKAARVGEPYRWVHQAKAYIEIIERLAPATVREPAAAQRAGRI